MDGKKYMEVDTSYVKFGVCAFKRYKQGSHKKDTS